VWSIGKLRDVDNAIRAVVQASVELNRHGDSRSSDGSTTLLIVALLKFMTLASALWTEFADYMMRKARQCKQSPAPHPSSVVS
jgi:hypothetical protein